MIGVIQPWYASLRFLGYFCPLPTRQPAAPKPVPFWAAPRPTVKQSVCTIGWVLSNENAYVCGALAMKITAGMWSRCGLLAIICHMSLVVLICRYGL
jgi:hypothetical protein